MAPSVVTSSAVFGKLWDKVDLDKNGTLSVDELRAMSQCLKDSGFQMAGIVASILKNSDLSNDGQISREEWDTYTNMIKYPEHILAMIVQTIDNISAKDVQAVLDKLQSNIPSGWVKNAIADGKVTYTNQELDLHATSIEQTWATHVIKKPPPGFLKVESRTRPGQYSYYHKASGTRVQNVEQAWALKIELDEKPKSANKTAPAPRDAAVHRQPTRTLRNTSMMKPDMVAMPPGFVDTEFPPNATSIGQVQEENPSSRLRISKEKKDAIKWIRLPELVRLTYPGAETVLFDDCIEPNDLTQGQVGDCWLLASIAGLAEFPSAVKNLFVDEYNSEGKYAINLYDLATDKWECVVIDDSVPCLYEEDWSDVPCHFNDKGQLSYQVPSADYKPPMHWVPLFARLSGPEIWPLLLEKAVAKFCGGAYANIAGGHEPFAYIMFTGYPIVYVYQRPRKDENATSAELGVWERGQSQYDPRVGRKRPTCGYKKLDDQPLRDGDQFFKKLVSYDLRNYLMGASITAFEQPASILGYFQPNGIVLGHAYSLISATYVNETLKNGSVKTWNMVQLRNPHGAGSKTGATEWNGRWSDNSPLWKEHPQVADALNFECVDDGLFWMECCDFCDIFDRIHILAKSMEQPRAQEALERRSTKGDFGIGVEGLDTTNKNALDYRRMTIQIDPFQNAPKWVSQKGINGLMQWYKEKGTLSTFLSMNPWMKERAEKAGLL
eukprot:GEMP01010050.1.p1 GENE.GEMP01010050.1~~GEMP01010050.1.p1  ORF type:complete len:722 (+),score=193.44 GEMP01010050.1:59-2224(+)